MKADRAWLIWTAIALGVVAVVVGVQQYQHKQGIAASHSPGFVQSGAGGAMNSTASQSSTPAVGTRQENPKDEWSEATPMMRRTMLATRVRNRWQNVVVENQGDVMTVTHPGMDEDSARKIIDDIGTLAREAGLRRIDFVSAGGMCQVTYTKPYCEYSCEEKAECSPADSDECNLLCCSIHGYPVEQMPAGVRQEPCPPHTWVYNVPPQ